MTPSALARDAAIATARAHASPEWLEAAERAVRNCAEDLGVFTTDDVWRALYMMRRTTHEPRALGSVMRAAVAAGICEPTGQYRASKRERCHARPVLVYRRAGA